MPLVPLSRNPRLQPHDQVRDARLHTVRPVIGEDLAVGGIGEGDGRFGGECRARLSGGCGRGKGSGEGRPVQALLEDEVGYGAVGGFGGVCPCDVPL